LQTISYPNYKIIVVDNASGDGSVQALRSEFPTIDIIENQKNLRFAGGNNIGLRYALEKNAEYVLLLNNDTIVEKNFLFELVHCAENDERVGIAGAKIYYYTERNKIWYAGGKIEWNIGWISHRGIRETDFNQYDQEEETDYVTGCCMLLKRNLIEKIGVLDEAYFIYGEDADWCMRAKNNGYKLMYVPTAKLYHKVSISSGGNFSWFKNWNKLKSNFRFFFRYAEWYQLVLLPFAMVIKVSISFIRARK
jgi:GT2 family glycosyltransferase